MAITASTMKRLFGLSRNQCTMPDCESPIIIGEAVVGEICHIRARGKGGARYDSSLTAAQKDDFENLTLLCGTCHTLVKNLQKFQIRPRSFSRSGALLIY